MTHTPQYYIAWNSAKTEGFITDDRDDCMRALGRKPRGNMESTLGSYFRKTYSKDNLPPIQTVKVLK